MDRKQAICAVRCAFTKPENRMNVAKEFFEQLEGVTGSLASNPVNKSFEANRTRSSPRVWQNLCHTVSLWYLICPQPRDWPWKFVGCLRFSAFGSGQKSHWNIQFVRAVWGCGTGCSPWPLWSVAVRKPHPECPKSCYFRSGPCSGGI